MEKWKYKSLAWIHKIREDDYEKTRDVPPKELVAMTRRAGENIVKGLGLKVIPSKTAARRG